MNRAWWAFATSASVLVMACGGAGGAQLPTNTGGSTPAASGGSPPDGAAVVPGGGTTPASGGGSLDAQVASGKALYGANCASCHGANGTGGEDPAVVGIKTGALPIRAAAGSKRTAKFQTASDLYQYVKTTMPQDGPGTLKDGEYLAVTAWMLQANGIAVSAPLDATNAASINLH